MQHLRKDTNLDKMDSKQLQLDPAAEIEKHSQIVAAFLSADPNLQMIQMPKSLALCKEVKLFAIVSAQCRRDDECPRSANRGLLLGHQRAGVMDLLPFFNDACNPYPLRNCGSPAKDLELKLFRAVFSNIIETDEQQ